MAFRTILVGAVVALGMDLPTGSEIQNWVRTGESWWNARVAELEARHGIALSPLDSIADERVEATPEFPEECSEATFATVVDDWVAVVSEPEQDSKAEPIDTARLVAGAESVEFGFDFGFALEPNAFWIPIAGIPQEESVQSDPPPAIEMSSTDSALDIPLAVEDVVEVVVEANSSVTETPRLSSADREPQSNEIPRLTAAIRLTGEALSAWLVVLNPSGLETTALK